MDDGRIFGRGISFPPRVGPDGRVAWSAGPDMPLLQLFAFMTEILLYRSNLIPERNRRKFLQLLDVPMRPASAARGVATIVNQRGPLEAIPLPAGVPVLAGAIGFITTRAL